MSYTASFPLILPTVDSAGNPSTQQIGFMFYDPARGIFDDTQALPDTAARDLIAPVAGVTLWAAMVRNNSPVANLTVRWTPVAGAQGIVEVLAPGSMIFFADTPGGQGGITRLSIQSDVAGAPYAYFATA